ncbi:MULTISPECIES: hypothetical protein [Streptomyces]|uniref:Uncharacterized protein n=2 Tax=Streptomyces nigrescens TaxID=1920 RepID=A0A640TDM6_STRNI|nr:MULTISPECIES: hypothetical protein [Streptomyces]MCX5447296.1 hypothetical protein [Streptomyces libani]WAT95953.1 hypothetical protein STRLI_001734 [Streptomyces libani subsp. libani]WAU03571.1 hypothetical protein STRNI_001726 [Streptomyces nigrescens]WDT58324.1 hypothetical protein NUT86_32120 [Streptomyces sp. G7(2002)]GFE21264.1 hypothetical protein Sliba_17170 [Streptomyces libani subsp. libani]
MTGPSAAAVVSRPGWVAETRTGLRLDPSDGTPAAEVAREYVAHLDARASDGRLR